MSSGQYRYCALDDLGRLHKAVWFRAGSDRDAVSQIQDTRGDSTCEIWQGMRIVARISPLNSAF